MSRLNILNRLISTLDPSGQELKLLKRKRWFPSRGKLAVNKLTKHILSPSHVRLRACVESSEVSLNGGVYLR